MFFSKKISFRQKKYITLKNKQVGLNWIIYKKKKSNFQ